MSRTAVKYVAIVLIVGGIALSATGIGAFSTVTADRQMFVGVGGESTSYLGISVADTTVTTNGSNDERGGDTTRLSGTQETSSTVVLGSVTNYFPATLDSIELTVSKTSGSLTVSNPHVKNLPLESGGQRNLLATVNCGGASSGTVTLTFEVWGTDTHATTKRTVPVTCVNKTSPSAPLNTPQLPSPRQMNTGSA